MNLNCLLNVTVKYLKPLTNINTTITCLSPSLSNKVGRVPWWPLLVTHPALPTGRNTFLTLVLLFLGVNFMLPLHTYASLYI